MAHRPYPNAARALRHVKRQRHDGAWSYYNRLAQLQPDVDATLTIQAAADKQGYVMFPPGEYRLSTRPGVVGGPA